MIVSHDFVNYNYDLFFGDEQVPQVPQSLTKDPGSQRCGSAIACSIGLIESHELEIRTTNQDLTYRQQVVSQLLFIVILCSRLLVAFLAVLKIIVKLLKPLLQSSMNIS